MRRRVLQAACWIASRHRLTEYDFLPDVYHCACKRRQETTHARRCRIAHTHLTPARSYREADLDPWHPDRA